MSDWLAMHSPDRADGEVHGGHRGGRAWMAFSMSADLVEKRFLMFNTRW